MSISPDAYISPHATVHPSAVINPYVSISAGTHISRYVELRDLATIGGGVSIAERTGIGAHSIVEGGVQIGRSVSIANSALILAGAVICPNKVRSVSSNGRELREEVTVGPNVLLHDEVELGSGAIIPTQKTIAMIGSFGKKRRVVTIYGSDEGPRYSIGCMMGRPFDKVKEHVMGSTNTTEASANAYLPFLDIFNEIGGTVQRAYDAETGLVEELKLQRAESFSEAALEARRRHCLSLLTPRQAG